MEHKHRHSRKPWSKFINTDNQHLVSPEVYYFGSRTIINKIRGDARGNRVRFPRELRAKEHLPRGGIDTPHVRKNQN
ncbi:unnamed protein product [Brassica rapa subsp. narinosa]